MSNSGIMIGIMGAIGTVIAFFFLYILLLMIGWHLFAVPVLGLPELTFWQAFGLNLVGAVFRGLSK